MQRLSNLTGIQASRAHPSHLPQTPHIFVHAHRQRKENVSFPLQGLYHSATTNLEALPSVSSKPL